MKIKVKIKAGAKKSKVKESGKNLLIFTKNQPIQGKANQETIGLLAEYYGKNLSKIKIISGLKSKNKIIEINN